MSKATITVRDLANGRVAIKLNLDPGECPASPAHQVASSFLAWLATQNHKQVKPAARQHKP